VTDSLVLYIQIVIHIRTGDERLELIYRQISCFELLASNLSYSYVKNSLVHLNLSRYPVIKERIVHCVV
jgi:hypothetical protein